MLILLPYYFKFRRTQHQNLMEHKQARQIGIDRPRGQFPFIDSSRCIGCGACVRACPEGDVLGVIHGTATVIKGMRCVGHGYCADACPVGAITVGIGDLREREDIPILNEFNQASVPGLYIAGELSGLSLIRNAISQGKLVVDRIAQQASSLSDQNCLDLVIVGAGPAGLSAALTARQHKLSYLVLDQEEEIGGTIYHYPRRKVVMTQPVEIPLYGWLKKTEYSKERLVEIWKEIEKKYRLPIQTGKKVEQVSRQNGHFAVRTQQQLYQARFVVLALGRRGTPRKLGVPGEELPKVMYKLTDAQTYRGLSLLVIGSGDSAMEAAIGLAEQPRNNAYLVYLEGALLRIKKKNEIRIKELIRQKKIYPLVNAQVQEIDDKSVTLNWQDRIQKLPNDYIFVLIGGDPPFKMMKDMGIAFGGKTATPDVMVKEMPTKLVSR